MIIAKECGCAEAISENVVDGLDRKALLDLGIWVDEDMECGYWKEECESHEETIAS